MRDKRRANEAAFTGSLQKRSIRPWYKAKHLRTDSADLRSKALSSALAFLLVAATLGGSGTFSSVSALATEQEDAAATQSASLAQNSPETDGRIANAANADGAQTDEAVANDGATADTPDAETTSGEDDSTADALGASDESAAPEQDSLTLDASGIDTLALDAAELETEELQPLAVIGAFNVDGGVSGTDYTYTTGTPNVLAIRSSTPLTISMASGPTATDVIAVAVPTGVSANVALRNVSIDVSGIAGAAALDVDGGSLTLTLEGANNLQSASNRAGLQLQNYANLIITAASNGSSLNATGGRAGIGAGVSTNNVSADNAGNITINGGAITATGGADGGAGIGGGGGGDTSSSHSGNITINGGVIKATGGARGGAGIGGGFYHSSSGMISIGDGEIEATGGADGGAGIGGGYLNSPVGAITITNNSRVNANTNFNLGGAGIGGGRGDSPADSITISASTITTSSHNYGAGIGGGNDDSGVTGAISIAGANVDVSGGASSGNTDGGAGIGGGFHASSVGSLTISGSTVTAVATACAAGIGGGGDASTVTGNITITYSVVTATSGYYSGAGIGGGDNNSGAGPITITGGIISATGVGAGIGGLGVGGGGAGIGGGNNGSGVGAVHITGGMITSGGGAVGGAGIGGGTEGSGADSITITGGTITASPGSTNSQDIGNGDSNGSNDAGFVTIDGGSVWAQNGAVLPAPLNSAGVAVYANTLTLGSPAVGGSMVVTAGTIDGVACANTPNASAGVYGIFNVETNAAGQVCFWLPATDTATEKVALSANGRTFERQYARPPAPVSQVLLEASSSDASADGDGGDGTLAKTGDGRSLALGATALLLAALGAVTLTRGIRRRGENR
jgi:hypothetical protein